MSTLRAQSSQVFASNPVYCANSTCVLEPHESNNLHGVHNCLVFLPCGKSTCISGTSLTTAFP
eukprot:2984380-Amphidinium_carterae.1